MICEIAELAMSNFPTISLSEMRSWLSYDPETGKFTRLNGYKVGQEAGYVAKDGYIYISLLGKKYYAHLLAWWFTHGEWPCGYIDHINRVKSDNRASNLRIVTARENKLNMGMMKTNKSGLKGVVKKGNRWRAGITVNYKKVWLGYYETPEEAHAAYCEATQKHGGEYACFG